MGISFKRLLQLIPMGLFLLGSIISIEGWAEDPVKTQTPLKIIDVDDLHKQFFEDFHLGYRDAIGNVDVNGAKYNLYILEGGQANDQIELFNNEIKHKGLAGHIWGCKRVIEIPAGTAGGNHSYGGICLLESGGKIGREMLCKDDFVGRLQMKPLQESESVDTADVVSFVIDNCVGG
jgi:hypothetical protein